MARVWKKTLTIEKEEEDDTGKEEECVFVERVNLIQRGLLMGFWAQKYVKVNWAFTQT